MSWLADIVIVTIAVGLVLALGFTRWGASR
jgi:hypothetical protein